MRTLVVAPHPDDEVIGCGGSIVKWTQAGVEVHVLLVTQVWEPKWSEAELAKRFAEAHDAAECMGLHPDGQLWTARFPTTQLNITPAWLLAESLSDRVADIQPDTLIIPALGDVNRDHEEVHKACLVASRPHPGCPVKRVWAYETTCTAAFATSMPGVFRPDVYEVLAPVHANAKLEAMKCYKSEQRDWPHPRSVKALAHFCIERGARVGEPFAECFQIIREIRP